MDQEKMFALFCELHSGNPQEGPGDFASTERAFRMLRDIPPRPRILDIGCGPGRQTLDLLRLTDGTVTAVDNLPGTLAQLEDRARAAGVAERVTTVAADMARLDLPERAFDIVWAEGSIYCMGFEKGFLALKRHLREGGSIAASELTRLQPAPPEEAVAFWEGEYPAMRDVAGNLAIIENAGYRPVGHFTLPESAWWRYYEPLLAKHEAFRERHADDAEAAAVLAQERMEVEMYRNYSAFYGYVFFVAQKQ